jgi:curved DNA-binding protein
VADKDLYAILGVSRGASDDEIRKAFRKLARENHPDVNPNDPQAEERFKDIAFAYEVLSDADKRKRYTEFGVDGLAEGFDPEQARAYREWAQGTRRSPYFESFQSSIDLEDLLGDLFGGSRRRGPRRGRDLESTLEIDFTTAAIGGEVSISVAGSSLRVRIPAGSEEGTKVRLAGKGEPGSEGAPAGNLYLNLRVRPHAFFRREGDDVRLEVPITLPEAALGAEIEVPTPHGVVKMKVPPGAQSGQSLRLRGKGAGRRGSSGFGDLYVQLQLRLPERQSEKLTSLAREMEPLYEEADVRARLKS